MAESSQVPPIEQRSMLDLIGNTSVVPIVRSISGDAEKQAKIFVKLECNNPTGSYKDRMALSMIDGALASGTLRVGMTVIEATGGSTGTSLSFVCAQRGVGFCAHTATCFAVEKLRSITAYGGTLELIETKEITSDLFPRMLRACAQWQSDEPDKYFYSDQFNNKDVVKGFEAMGHELVQQFPDGIDAFCACTGTAGMLMGVSKVLKKHFPAIHVVLIEPSTSAVISKGASAAGKHGVDGVAPGFRPPHLDDSLYDEVFALDEQKGRALARTLAQKEGIMAGTSTGLNVLGATMLADRLGPGKTVVTVACDSGLKYLSTPLFA